ncbi:unnamed protein product [Effrenium voratum]|nr:unnamed protein product [Effrenium voratum]
MDWAVEDTRTLDMKSSLAVRKLMDIQDSIPSSVVQWDDGLFWRLSGDAPVGLYLEAMESSAPQLSVAFQAHLPAEAVERAGLRELAAVFDSEDISRHPDAAKFRLYLEAAAAIWQREGGPPGPQNGASGTGWEGSELARLASRCPVSCELCGLEGFQGADMGAHLRSKGHQRRVGQLRRAVQCEQKDWLCRRFQLWPASDGTLFEVDHLSFEVAQPVEQLESGLLHV